MVLACSSCGAPFEEGDVEAAGGGGIARCRHCRAVTRIAPAVGAAPPRPQVPMPRGFSVEDTGSRYVVVRRWCAATWIVVFCFAIAWNGFLLFWYRMALSEGAPWIMVVFPVAHVAVGIGLLYVSLAGLLNRTTVEVAGGTLSVRHGPIPWRGDVTLEADRIAQVCCEARSSRRSDDARNTYLVTAVLREGGRVRLLTGLTDVEHALYVEQRIEERLGIRDRPVPGELPR